ncbi:HAMP domain-containing sensor histidine kinase [Microbispora hainanensis]|uniref:histidine kinase n=1 Tax=Microbispora hainanensis TaxID=568844 RepID=A0A544YMR6_9ACTN|nr:HAMP domain-containing sensor histidine kinase [Microbispora hainanensis]TQS18053.1 HAMP domain-containing histidine kinase [Microbispora hainanensis]
MRADVPLHRSLLVRVLAVSVLVSVCSIAATAWLTARSTTVAIRQEQGQALTDDARTYDTLLGYAATHPGWNGAGEVVRQLARDTGRRVTITTEQRVPLVDSDSGPPAKLPARPTASIDPLHIDTALAAASGSSLTTGSSDALVPQGDALAAVTDHIDPRAVGPFLLPRKERDALRVAAERRAACLRGSFGSVATIAYSPSGRPVLDTRGARPYSDTRCPNTVLDRPTATEAKALAALQKLVDNCLERRHESHVRLNLDFTWTRVPGAVPAQAAGDGPRGGVVPECVAGSRREQLTPYVAPPALLFLSSRGGDTSTVFDLSPENQARIAGVAALVLLITVTASVTAGTRLSRPLRALTDAVRQMEEGRAARVEVKGKDEIGRLAAAFNAMAERRERLEELRKAMVGDVAHELRTPLSNIRGWLEAAQDGLADPDPELVASLLEEALLLQHVIDDLQDLAVADAGELRVHTEPVDVADLLAQVATAHRGGAEAAGVTLLTKADGRLHLVADPVRLRQAVGNLVSNAVRHTPPGGTVSLHARRADGDVVIDVADTGSGIAPDDLPLVFERFWRVEKSRSRRSGGSGLGLPIARKLAEAHGGSLSATSVIGEGSTFTLRLPA